MVNRTWLSAALLGSLLGVAGCGGHTAGSGNAARPAQSPPGTRASTPLAASTVAPRCNSADLGSAFRGGLPGAGNDFATLVFWDKSANACRFTGPVTVVGLNAAGRPVTNPVRLTVAGNGELTPRGTAPGADGTLRAGESAASILISAEYRDDPTSSNGLCTAHQLEPASFRVTLPAGGSLTLVNATPATKTKGSDPTANGGLATCRGELNTGSGLTQITIGNTID
jgi:hypothetical protein